MQILSRTPISARERAGAKSGRVLGSNQNPVFEAIERCPHPRGPQVQVRIEATMCDSPHNALR